MKVFLQGTLLVFLFLLTGHSSIGQAAAGYKKFNNTNLAGEVLVYAERMEYNGSAATVYYDVEVLVAGKYYVKVLTNMAKGRQQLIAIDGFNTGMAVNSRSAGWQSLSGIDNTTNAITTIDLKAGRHVIAFTMKGNVPPMNDMISFNRSNSHPKLDQAWINLANYISTVQANPPASTEPVMKDFLGGKVLSNPSGNYEHAVDTAFNYSTLHWMFLTEGITYSFTTYNSFVDPVLHLFDPTNINTRSWSNDDSGPGYESSLVVTIPASGYYALLARPYFGNQSGITSIRFNGIDLLVNTGISGLRFSTSSRTGDLNYFSTKLRGVNGSNPDTRVFTLSSAGGVVTGYNDDYANTSGGTWSWGYASRIKRNYTTGSNTVFVCAYNTTSNGLADVYMGNTQGRLHITEPGNFPLVTDEDAIQSAPSSGSYNCISWTGGVTSTWIWPPNALSTYNCPAANTLQCFDNFYANNPVRYPGAWNYTRSLATSANASVDLWKQPTGAYQHGSIRKPGNDHPHGYDWESKPGGLDRQFHPRSALTNNNWYGVITNYYRSAGTFARMAGANQNYATDADAVKAGVAVFENAKLTAMANDKLSQLLKATDEKKKNVFNGYYETWKKTWEQNASMSDPDAYCKNDEFAAMAKWSQANQEEAMLFVFEKFTGGDHFITKLLLDLTLDRYSKLLNETKEEIIRNPYDNAGRYKIHGDHDNGIRYIEKILQQLELKPVVNAVVTGEAFTVNVSPNPVKDVMTITVELKETANMNIAVMAAQKGARKVVLNDTKLMKGQYQYRINRKELSAATGDLLIVQVNVNGVVKTVKVLAAE
jgi:hypothetical protein